MTDIWEKRFKRSEEIRTGLVREIHRQYEESERLRAKNVELRAALVSMRYFDIGQKGQDIINEALTDTEEKTKDKKPCRHRYYSAGPLGWQCTECGLLLPITDPFGPDMDT